MNFLSLTKTDFLIYSSSCLPLTEQLKPVVTWLYHALDVCVYEDTVASKTDFERI